MDKPKLVGLDTLTRSGAEFLCALIETYWHQRGFKQVRCEAYQIDPDEMPKVYGVRSNLVGGLPT